MRHKKWSNILKTLINGFGYLIVGSSFLAQKYDFVTKFSILSINFAIDYYTIAGFYTICIIFCMIGVVIFEE